MRRAYWWVRVVLLSLRWMRRLGIGDYVEYKGERWMLVQGVCRPSWDLVRKCTTGEEKRENHVHESEFKKIHSVSGYIDSFRRGYRFYMSNWYDSWVRGGIKPWMRGCRIWARD